MRKSLRPAAAFGIALLAVLLTTVPVLAASGTIMRRVGNYAYWYPVDQPGVIARYSTETSALRTLRVKPPVYVKGRYDEVQTIGWQFKVVSVPNPPSDAMYSTWTVIYKSPIWKDEASKTVNADFDGKWRTWFAPRNPTPGGYGIFYRVFWYLPGTTVVDGWTQDSYIRFKLNKGTDSYFRWYWCGDTYAGASTGT